MIIEGTDIEIPDSLIVPGDLNGTNITALPEGLSIGGSLNLRNTNVKVLPAGLSVGGYLPADAGQLMASERVQLELIEKAEYMLQVFKVPTERAQLLHQMLWKL